MLGVGRSRAAGKPERLARMVDTGTRAADAAGEPT
jgi:hypothetical protein